MKQNSSHSDKDQPARKNPKDKWIPLYFVAFFAVIALVDGIFVYMAVSTQTGVVTEHAYEKGLAFNETLAEARAQPALQQSATFEDGLLRWRLADEGGAAITHADVSAHIKRPVQDGFDFDIKLEHKGDGLYEAAIQTPQKGLWQAGLKSVWDNQKFQTSLKFISQ